MAIFSSDVMTKMKSIAVCTAYCVAAQFDLQRFNAFIGRRSRAA
jgi:uncharacterized Rmd1/YagE family protein